MINLRQYQIDAIQAIKDTFDKSWNRQYIVMPTGSGKTITFLSYAKQYHQRILIIVPSKELLKQVYETALKLYDEDDISRKGDIYTENPSKVHICIINSIRGEYLEFITGQYFDLVIIDEAHHSNANSYEKFLKNIAFAPKILGVTATPDRCDGKLLNSVLDTRSYEITVENLIENEFLSDIEGFSVKTNIDISDVDSHNGDFSLNQLYKKLGTDSRNQLIFDLCKNEMKDRKTLIFSINIEHSKQIEHILNEKNISCRHIDGKMNSSLRNSILSSFRNNEISILCNCQLLTEGFDEPSIDGIIIARPTKSRALFNQMIGRGLRRSPGKKNCKIIDIVDNHRNLRGFNCILDDIDYKEINSFKSIKDIRNHVSEEMIKLTEITLERVDFFGKKPISEIDAVPSMIEYLENNEIQYYEPISFNEASFLIWLNELKIKYNKKVI